MSKLEYDPWDWWLLVVIYLAWAVLIAEIVIGVKIWLQ